MEMEKKSGSLIWSMTGADSSGQRTIATIVHAQPVTFEPSFQYTTQHLEEDTTARRENTTTNPYIAVTHIDGYVTHNTRRASAWTVQGPGLAERMLEKTRTWLYHIGESSADATEAMHADTWTRQAITPPKFAHQPLPASGNAELVPAMSRTSVWLAEQANAFCTRTTSCAKSLSRHQSSAARSVRPISPFLPLMPFVPLQLSFDAPGQALSPLPSFDARSTPQSVSIGSPHHTAVDIAITARSTSPYVHNPTSFSRPRRFSIAAPPRACPLPVNDEPVYRQTKYNPSPLRHHPSNGALVTRPLSGLSTTTTKSTRDFLNLLNAPLPPLPSDAILSASTDVAECATIHRYANEQSKRLQTHLLERAQIVDETDLQLAPINQPIMSPPVRAKMEPYPARLSLFPLPLRCKDSRSRTQTSRLANRSNTRAAEPMSSISTQQAAGSTLDKDDDKRTNDQQDEGYSSTHTRSTTGTSTSLSTASSEPAETSSQSSCVSTPDLTDLSAWDKEDGQVAYARYVDVTRIHSGHFI